MPLSKYLELESDPGIFTNILNDLNINSLQVDEVYDLDSKHHEFRNSETIGYIFLFKWSDSDNKSKDNNDANNNIPPKTDKLIFLRQRATNSCASHALLNILFNTEYFRESETLQKIKKKLEDFGDDGETPAKMRKIASDRGKIIAQSEVLQKIHNTYANFYTEFEEENDDWESGDDDQDEGEGEDNENKINDSTDQLENPELEPKFHFTCYIPFKSQLIELDGLKSSAISHGEIKNIANWTRPAKQLIKNRISTAEKTSQYADIRYSLLAVTKKLGNIEELKLKYSDLVNNLAILTGKLNKILASKRLVRQSSVISDIKRQIRFAETNYLQNKSLKDKPNLKNSGNNLMTVFDEFKIVLENIQEVQQYLRVLKALFIYISQKHGSSNRQ